MSNEVGRYLLSAVSDESYKEFHAALLESENPFHLYIASPGGDTDSMWAFVDTILCSKRTIIGTAVGICHSAAPLILATCDVRQCTPNTQFMVHEDIIEAEGAPSNAIKTVNRAQAEEDRWYTAMSLATGTTINEWRVLSEAETYFDAFEAKRLGIVDKILPIMQGKKRRNKK